MSNAKKSPGYVANARNSDPGRAIYNYRCYFCHGYAGDAKTVAATYLSPPPRDFTTRTIDRQKMIAAVTHGSKGSAMMSFKSVLKPHEIEAVVDFVRQEFMQGDAKNTRYHTVENGWPNHDRYRAAFPFALGEVALDTLWDSLTPAQRTGRQLFMSGCVTCHEGSRRTPLKDDPMWDPRALSSPRNGYSHAVQGRTSAVSAGRAGTAAVQGRTSAVGAGRAGTAAVQATARMSEMAQQPVAVAIRVNAVTSAGLYDRQDTPPQLANLTAQEQQGELLFQKNCALCHAADGTGRNWIGRFLQPPPRNLTSATAMQGMTRARLKHVIRDGLPGTSMSAWKSVLNDDQMNAIIAYMSRAFYPMPE